MFSEQGSYFGIVGDLYELMPFLTAALKMGLGISLIILMLSVFWNPGNQAQKELAKCLTMINSMR